MFFIKKYFTMEYQVTGYSTKSLYLSTHEIELLKARMVSLSKKNDECFELKY